MKKSTWSSVVPLLVCLVFSVVFVFAGFASARLASASAGTEAKEVTLKGTLGCGKCSFHEAKACQNVLKVKTGEKVETYVLADNAVSKANHEKVCGPSSPATVTGTVSKKGGRKLLTASAITFE